MIIKRKKEEFQSYLEDTSNIEGDASVLFIPENVKELSLLLKDALKNNLPVTLSSAGTGSTGGRVPLEGAILSLERLNKIISVDTEKRRVKAEAGITLEDLEKELHKHSLTLRASPTESLASLGGAIATCASGTKSFKYGSIRDYVQSLTVVIGSGEILKIGRGKIKATQRKFKFKLAGKSFNFQLPGYTSPAIKSSAGYFVKEDMDLIDLFIGQEGTLGCVVEAELSVQPLPSDYFDCLVFFESDDDALGFIEAVKSLKKYNSFFPCALEFFDRNSLEFLRENYSHLPAASCAVYLEQEIELNLNKDKILDYFCQLIERHNSSIDKCWFAEDDKSRQKLYEFRHSLPQKINEFLKFYKQKKMATDIAVPDEHFREMYYFYKEKALKAQIDYVNFGHIGQNHLHFNFLPKNAEESFKAKGYILELIKKALSFNGTVSAEHGIGKLKRPYLEIMWGKAYLEEMSRLKRVFDPGCILGRDNIFSKDLLL